jgi:hypothetical protein
MLSYSLAVSRGYVRLRRHGERPVRPRPTWLGLLSHSEDAPDSDSGTDPDVEWAIQNVPDDPDDDVWWVDPRDELDPLIEAAIEEALHPHRGDGGQSARSRMNMRRLFLSLPWELLGRRPALISLTYPDTWQLWVPDGRTWERHRRALERRWVRRWREPLVGVWVKEFQNSGRPHLHLYVGLPTAMDHEGLRERTLLRHRLERQHGRYEGRKKLPAISQQFGGDFAMWLRTAWSEIVGTQGHVQLHHARGADVAVMFWSDEAEAKADRTVVAEYLAREASKWQQKKPPPGFGRIGRYYGCWGKSVGFRPEATVTALDAWVALEVEARLERWVNWKLHLLRRGTPPATALPVRRRGDGITAFGLGPGQAARILRWSEAAVARKRAKNSWRSGAGGGASGDIEELLRSMDLLNGGVLSVEDQGGPVQDVGLHGLQVAAHRRGGVAVAEDPLDVEQIEMVGPVDPDGAVENSGRCSA